MSPAAGASAPEPSSHKPSFRRQKMGRPVLYAGEETSSSLMLLNAGVFWCGQVTGATGSQLILICPDSDVSAAPGPGSSWRKAAFDDVLRISKLPQNWDGYGASQVSSHAITKALRLIHWLVERQAPRPHVVPTTAGGIQIEWHQNQVDAEIDIAADGIAEIDVADLTSGEEWSKPLEADAEALRQALELLGRR